MTWRRYNRRDNKLVEMVDKYQMIDHNLSPCANCGVVRRKGMVSWAVNLERGHLRVRQSNSLIFHYVPKEMFDRVEKRTFCGRYFYLPAPYVSE